MRKHFKNFGRELAFLLVLIMTLSSGGLQMVFAAGASKAGLRAAISSYVTSHSGKNGIKIPYKVGGYPDTDTVVTAVHKVASAKDFFTSISYNFVSITKASSLDVTGNFGTLKTVTVKSSASVTTVTTMDIVVNQPLPSQLVEEARAQLGEQITNTASSIGIFVHGQDAATNNWHIPYKVGGYQVPQDIADAAAEAINNALQDTWNRGMTTTDSAYFKARKLDAVAAAVEKIGNKFQLTLSTPGGTSLQTNIEIYATTPNHTENAAEAALYLLDYLTLELPFSAYNTTQAVAKAQAELNTILDDHKTVKYKATLQYQTFADAAATVLYDTITRAYQVETKDDGLGTYTNVGYLSLSMKAPANQEMINLATIIVTDITLDCQSTATDVVQSALTVAIREMLDKGNEVYISASSGGYWAIPIPQILDVTFTFAKATGDNYNITLKYGNVTKGITRSVKVTVMDPDKAAIDEMLEFLGDGINIPAGTYKDENEMLPAIQNIIDEEISTNPLLTGMTATVIFNKVTAQFDVNLLKGQEAYTQKNITVGILVNTEALKDLIVDAEDLLPEEDAIQEDGTEPKDVPVGNIYWLRSDVEEFQAAIDDAQEISDNSTNSEAVNKALTDLQAAMDKFVAAKKTGTREPADPAELNALIDEAKAMIPDTADIKPDGTNEDEVLIGETYWLDGDVKEFQDAIDDAQDIADNAEYADEVAQALTDLQAAMDKFDAAKKTGTRELADPTDLYDRITKAAALIPDTADIKPDNTNEADVTLGEIYWLQGEVDKLEQAIADAKDIADNSEDVDEITQALTDLQAAMDAFNASKKTGTKQPTQLSITGLALTDPSNIMRKAGSEIEITANVIGGEGELTYYWYYIDSSATPGGMIPIDQNSPVLKHSLTVAVAPQWIVYGLAVVDSQGTTEWSDYVWVFAWDGTAPIITDQPLSYTEWVAINDSVAFDVTATGAQPMSYIWHVFFGNTVDTLAIQDASALAYTPNHGEGWYAFVVAVVNPAGVTWSDIAWVYVYDPATLFP